MSGGNRLSVCLLGYRHEPYVAECVSAIWAGGHDNVEIVALDDGSNDGTIRKLQDMSAQSPYPLKILEQPNSGNIAANFNRLLEHASGDYVFFSALDDAPMPGSLGRMMDIARDGDLAFVAHTHALMMGENAYAELQRFAPASSAATVEELLGAEYNWLHSFFIQGAIFRRDILNEIGGFEPDMLGDDIVLRTKIFLRLKKRPAQFHLIDGPGCVYRQHGGNVSKNTARQVKLGMQYMDRFWQDRPYPEILRKWVIAALQICPLAEVLPVFRFGKKGGEFLKDPEIREMIASSSSDAK